MKRVLIPYKKKVLLHKFVTFALFLAFLAVTCSGCSSPNAKISKSDFYFDTVITITLYQTNDASIIDECFQLADYYEKLLSNKIEESDISKINAAAGSYVTCKDETIEILKKSITYSEASSGAFDVTIGKLCDLWNFSEISAETEDHKVDASFLPDRKKLEECISHVNYHNIVIDENRVCLLDPECEIDLGAITKGYIADQMQAFLLKKGVTSGIINLGGNIKTIGPKADHTSYTVGIQKPFAPTGESLIKVFLSNGSVVTSGIYERYFTVDGVIYHHILDPRTGYSIENDLASVTIINQCSMDGDALSTTCFLLGKDAAMEYIEALADTEAIFIDTKNQIYTTRKAQITRFSNKKPAFIQVLDTE